MFDVDPRADKSVVQFGAWKVLPSPVAARRAAGEAEAEGGSVEVPRTSTAWSSRGEGEPSRPGPSCSASGGPRSARAVLCSAVMPSARCCCSRRLRPSFLPLPCLPVATARPSGLRPSTCRRRPHSSSWTSQARADPRPGAPARRGLVQSNSWHSFQVLSAAPPAVIMLVCRFVGIVFKAIGQPTVIGEIIAGAQRAAACAVRFGCDGHATQPPGRRA